MRIVAVCACTMGVAHTYIAKDKLVEAAVKLGHSIKCETQGSVGAECILDDKDIRDADVVILASDINVNDVERFEAKPIVRVSVTIAIKQPKQLINKIEYKLKEKKNYE